MKYIALLLMTLLSSVTYAIEIPKIPKNELIDLNAISKNFDLTKNANENNRYKGKSCALKSAVSALKFREFGMPKMENLFQNFSVNDYDERESGERNIIPSNEIIAVVGSIESTYPSISDGRINMLIAFCAFKDENVWFQAKGNTISAARFFRTAFFAAIFKKTAFDAVEVSNSIDFETRKRNKSPNQSMQPTANASVD